MYRHAYKRCALLLVAGTALQLSVGDLNPSFLAYPWGVILAVNYLYLLVMMYFFADKWTWVKTLYDRPACISSLASLLVLTLVFGLVRQDDATGGLVGALGFSRMTSSWIFNLFLVYFMTVIGLMVIDDVYHWKKRPKVSLAFHVLFFVILVSAIFGSGDKVRVRVVTTVGRPVQGGFTQDNQAVTLPFSLLLKEFTMDEYPPRLYLVEEGKLSKAFVEVGESGAEGRLGAWQVRCEEYLEMAGRMSPDSAFRAMNHVGATSAARVRAVHAESGKSVEGWVSCGSHIFAGSTLTLPDGNLVVMPKREPKKYLSRVEAADMDGRRDLEIRVNHPATVGAWKIYQVGYDNDRGRWSTTSVLECVRDGWYAAIHVALWLVLAAGAGMFVFGWKNKDKEGRS